MNKNLENEFEAASSRKQASLWVELFQLLRHNKKYWMLPLLVALLVMGLLIVFSGTAAAPFLYTFF
jgi:fluoride ion exporter CrcB/FEX